MTLGLALLASNLLLRWPWFGSQVYPIAERLAKWRRTLPWLTFLLALLFTAAAWFSGGWWRVVLGGTLMLLLFSGQPLRREEGLEPPAQAERLARSLRRYFVPLPIIAFGGIWGIVVLWWLRFTPVPGRQTINRVLNLRLAQLAGLHYSLVRQSRASLQWSLAGAGKGGQSSLFSWCLQFLARTRDETTFASLWKTFVSLRWQWLAMAVLVRWWLGN
ncbi:hypothetical protein E4656_11450 [Natronospirillum operosum]|uniref:Uncharacterized protein n=1 Tax=Natronospirillum operosum TaxID=2759953 RepID=A0A4Z0W988_9GAMM|nr:hypothetical protein [Natronospirillum operosum]TGG92743.1 hypothetical protein E4656_11450 [Natronospirillum operosum]